MKPTDTFKALPLAAQRAIVMFGFAGMFALASAIRHDMGGILSVRLMVLLLFATLTALLKARLYRGTTLSFLTAIVLMAVIRDSAAVSIIIAIWGVTVQTLFPSRRLIPYRLAFNSGMIAVTAGASSCVYHAFVTNNHSVPLVPNGILATILAAFVYFSGNSISMSFIVAITQRVSIFDIWMKHFMCSAQSFLMAGLLAFFVTLVSIGFMVIAVSLTIVFSYYCAIRHAARQSTPQSGHC